MILPRGGQVPPNQLGDERLESVDIDVIPNSVPLSQCVPLFDVAVVAGSTAGLQLQLAGLHVFQIGWSILSGCISTGESVTTLLG